MATKKRFYSSSKKRKSMLSEDRNAIANMPQDVIYKAWDRLPLSGDVSLDDTINGIDDQISADIRKKDRYRSEDKY